MEKVKTATKQIVSKKQVKKEWPKKPAPFMRVVGLYSDFKWRMLMVIIIGVIGIIAFSLMPGYTNNVFNSLDNSLTDGMAAELNYILRLLGIFVTLALVNEIFSIVCVFLILDYEAKAIQRAHIKVKSKLDVVPISFINKYSVGDLTRIVAYNVTDTMRSMLATFYQIARASFFYITTSIAMFGINPMLALVVISSLPLCILTARFVSRRTQKYFNRQNTLNGKLSTHIDQKVSLHSFYKANGLDGDISEFKEQNDGFAQSQVGEITATHLNTMYITFINNFMSILITVLCCILYINGEILFGAIPAFLMFSQRFLANAVIVTAATNLLQLVGSRAEQVFSVLDCPDDVTEKEWKDIDHIRGEIQFKGVTLIENGERHLDDVSFLIPQGKSVAFVGPAGGGKSKVVQLLSKLAIPTSGQVIVDGIDLSEIKSASYYSRMGIAFERPYIFRGTVAENILYGIRRAMPENVMTITKRLGSHSFIELLPKKYETELSENSGFLSVSQKQAINVARTVLQAPDLIIMEEALSSSDNVTEKVVFEEIIKGNFQQSAEGHRTKIFVTHRLGSIQTVDIIFFMENGKIVERGTHAELMKKKKKYYKAFVG
jgi:ATP-binding cassette subfamily B protein